MHSPTLNSVHDITIEIGDIPILVRTDNTEFARLLADRYGEFVNPNSPPPQMELEIRLVEEAGLGARDKGHGTRDTGDGTRDVDVVIRDSSDGNDLAAAVGNQEFNARLGHTDPEFRVPSPESREPSDSDSLPLDPDAEVSVRLEGSHWVLERGDFRADWDPQSRHGWVRQTINPYSIDGVLRILHSLILSRQGGLLVHGASAMRNGKAFVFAGISGTGKTTISRLAPADVTLLTDEISYLRPNVQESGARDTGHGTRDTGGVDGAFKSQGETSDSRFKIQDPESLVPSPESRVPSSEPLTPDTGHLTPAFSAYGTPFAGELARIGVKTRAPLAELFLLKQGPENRIEEVSDAQAVRELMRHILFFAHDPELVELVFQSVCDFVKRVQVRRLVFKKDASVWNLIG